jgi:hypothetical protein
MIKRLLIYSSLVLTLLLIAAAVVVLAGRLTLPSAHAQVSAQAQVTKACTIWEIAIFPNRVHVLCTTPYIDGAESISYFAYPTSDSAGASRYLSLFETAKATGVTVTIYFNTGDHTGTTFGCQAADCRKITGAQLP